ncbi:MAG: putative membrane protein YfcA, partial [Brevundimonas sp.]
MHYFGNSLKIISDPSIYLLILISGAFTAAFVQGASGFGSGLVLNAFWLHIMEPAIAIPLNIITCLLISGWPLFKLRKTLDFSKLRPFVISGLIGIPLGMLLLKTTDPRLFKISIGIFLVFYAILIFKNNNLSVKVNNNKLIDRFIGLISGFMGGFAALGGIFPTIWVSLQKLPKNTQRGTYEPF